MITQIHKEDIGKLLKMEKTTLGSWQQVANKVDANIATISRNMLYPEHWGLVADKMWVKVAAALNYKLTSKQWVVVDTTNTKIMSQVFTDAQTESLFMAISEKAGSGKTASILKFKQEDESRAVYVMQCEEWSRKQFLIRVAENLGIELKGYNTGDHLLEQIVRFFKGRVKDCQPLLILDEADKLRPAALRFLIPFYNRLEDEVGLVICGTENLEKEIKAGVRRAIKGYDEIDSRLGRHFIHLVGATRADVAAICEANGISSREKIQSIFREAQPEQRLFMGKYVDVIDDMRRLKRIIKRERARAVERVEAVGA